MSQFGPRLRFGIDREARRRKLLVPVVALLLAAAFVPATLIVWMITDHFQASSILHWAPGWVQSDPGFAVPSLQFWFVKIPSALGFWIYNFGLMLPEIIALVGVIGWLVWKDWEGSVAAHVPAAALDCDSVPGAEDPITVTWQRTTAR